MMKNKRAWIRIVEAFVAILLIVGIMLLVIDDRYTASDPSSDVYLIEISVLRDIQLNQTLRDDILNSPVPLSWENEQFPEHVKNKILNEIPSNLDCIAEICDMYGFCILEEADGELDKEIYAQSVAITANLQKYEPRQLKLFCWFK